MRHNLGGVDASAPVSPFYGRSRFDDLSSGMRRRMGERVHYRVEAVAPTQRKKKSRQGQVSALIPFGASAHRHVEPFGDVTLTPGTTTQRINLGDIPSYGYIRHVWLLVTGAGGVGGALGEDGPWNALSEISLSDVNGATIFGPLDGFQAFCANLFGGYAFHQDPRVHPAYSATAPNFAFALRVPVEIHANNGLGSLANQNAAATYRLSATLNTLANIFPTAPTTAPTIRVRAFLEAWSLPDKVDRAGRPQAQLPPLHGTTQFWTASGPETKSAGRGSVAIKRVGNLLRTIVFICRAGGARSNAVFPEQAELWWDNRVLLMEHRDYRRARMAEGVLTAAAGLPTGVFAYSFDDDVLGHVGDGTPELWLPTVQSTRLELQGTFGAGDVQTLINDVAPVEVDQSRRYVETSETGFEPAV